MPENSQSYGGYPDPPMPQGGQPYGYPDPPMQPSMPQQQIQPNMPQQPPYGYPDPSMHPQPGMPPYGNPPQKKGLGVGAIVAIVAGVLAVGVLVGFLLLGGRGGEPDPNPAPNGGSGQVSGSGSSSSSSGDADTSATSGTETISGDETPRRCHRSRCPAAARSRSCGNPRIR